MKRVCVGNVVVVRVKRDNMKMYSKDVQMILVLGVLRGGIAHYSTIGN